MTLVPCRYCLWRHRKITPSVAHDATTLEIPLVRMYNSVLIIIYALQLFNEDQVQPMNV